MERGKEGTSLVTQLATQYRDGTQIHISRVCLGVVPHSSELDLEVGIENLSFNSIFIVLEFLLSWSNELLATSQANSNLKILGENSLNTKD